MDQIMFRILNFTIKEFNKRLKRSSSLCIFARYFTIKEFNKRLKRFAEKRFSKGKFYHKRI